MNQIITISREFGSGGRELGRRLSELLHFAYYDQEIITEIAKRTDLAEDYVRQITESRPMISYPIHIGVTFQRARNEAIAQKAAVFQEQCDLLKELAEKSNCVIVGRSADNILSAYAPYRIFVYSDLGSKMARCRLKGKEEQELSEHELKRQIRAVDKRRAEYYNFLTGQNWGDKENYDLCINTANRSVKKMAPGLAQMLSSAWDKNVFQSRDMWDSICGFEEEL